MAWLQLHLTLGAADAERAEAALLAAGALSVTCTDAADQPVYEPDPRRPANWSQTRLSALFPDATDHDALRAVLIATLGTLPAHVFSTLADRAWSREWLKDFKPMRFGKRLWIVPSTFAAPDPQATNIRLDPGLAFGTGTHPTTALCLEWLDAADLNAQTVIDFGCGSGILSIAAALLGARQVLAIDNDPQALLATRANAARNQVSKLVQAWLPEMLPTCAADVLLANILAAPLRQLAAHFATLVKPGGRLVLSGILADQNDELQTAYAPHFRITGVEQKQEWLRLDGVRCAGER